MQYAMVLVVVDRIPRRRRQHQWIQIQITYSGGWQERSLVVAGDFLDPEMRRQRRRQHPASQLHLNGRVVGDGPFVRG